ncbi:MAG TPA: hypothetical protein VN853_13250 [Polyangia bacterium]|jgi:hypothetical protein|nr:hypothetical protein [Polyangia bacterium]
MKRILMALIPAAFMTFGTMALAADAPAAKPDCTTQQKALDDANAAVKTASAKPDLSSCKDKKGKDKTDCEKPLKDTQKAAVKDAKAKAKEAKTAADCCKNPKKKGCAS